MMKLNNNIKEELKSLLVKFPSIGNRQAERFIEFIARSDSEFIDNLTKKLKDYKTNINECVYCGLLNLYSDKCEICLDTTRDKTKLILVEKNIDVNILEQNTELKTYYFILSRLIPIATRTLNTYFVSDLKKIEERIKKNCIKEIIFALSSHPDADNTTILFRNSLRKLFPNLEISILGRGISTGLEIEYTDESTITNSIKNRNTIK